MGEADLRSSMFGYYNNSKLRLQYCESDTLTATDWHSHASGSHWTRDGKVFTSQEIFGAPNRSSSGPWSYDRKPMIAVSWELASAVGARMSAGSLEYRLPSEAEWERAARGCFPASAFPWGDAPPDEARADFDRFSAFTVRPSRAFPPNDYGLFALAGGVWEWCLDDYDATFYARSPEHSPVCRVPPTVRDREHVLRGGSWADCADTLRTSFRSSGDTSATPNIGFRLVRAVKSDGSRLPGGTMPSR
jgi:formylglycine-generating enzyme required for sulfatase activity